MIFNILLWDILEITTKPNLSTKNVGFISSSYLIYVYFIYIYLYYLTSVYCILYIHLPIYVFNLCILFIFIFLIYLTYFVCILYIYLPIYVFNLCIKYIFTYLIYVAKCGSESVPGIVWTDPSCICRLIGL